MSLIQRKRRYGTALSGGLSRVIARDPTRVSLYRPQFHRKRRGGGRSVKSANSIMANRMKFRGPGFVPQRYDTQFDYGFLYKFTDATGFYDWVIRANSLYDPDFALGGESATGLDAISGIYKHYKVVGCSIEVTGVNNDTDDPVHIVIIPNLFSASYAVANSNSILAMPYARSITIANQAGAGTVSNYMSSKVMFCVRDLDSVNFSSDVTTNPGTIWYWHVCMFNKSGNALNLEARLKCRFYTQMSELTAFNQ